MSSKGPIYQYVNCKLLRNHELVKEDLWVRDGIILNPEKVFFDERVAADTQIDCKGAIISAGFIDIQINGAFGVDFSADVDTIEDGVQKVAEGLLAHGVTSFCPTLVTSPKEIYTQIVPKVKKKNGSKDGAGILGLHLEGPFINKEKKGAHNELYIQTLENGFSDVMDTYTSLEDVAIVTLAPELDNSGMVIQELVNRGITVSVGNKPGHSKANLVQGELAVKQGASTITHLFNAMLPFHHRDPGLIGLLTSKMLPEDKTVYYGLISDGIHTHPAALRIAYRIHPEGMVLVTDAIPAMGLPQGQHHIGSQLIEIKDRGKRAVIAGTETLCGRFVTLILSTCCEHIPFLTIHCGKVFALEAATLHPAQVLGITDKKGTLDYYTEADFVILNDQLRVMATYIAGERVWGQSNLETVISRSDSMTDSAETRW
ncbi:hypothetical protein FSP39_014705 [Pinctada imbricata]|uniref:N-acetylglucosamine-6-phosphate deacetylase n=1 Tax=Pinctada imbricata TaxID=66713 RepID=A0AA88YEC9_PINIB|nr:hypothetical protein FSP39_014705 [Pinctada imbricata]